MSVFPSATADVQHRTMVPDRKVVYARLLIETIGDGIYTSLGSFFTFVKIDVQQHFIADLLLGNIDYFKVFSKLLRQDIACQ